MKCSVTDAQRGKWGETNPHSDVLRWESDSNDNTAGKDRYIERLMRRVAPSGLFVPLLLQSATAGAGVPYGTGSAIGTPHYTGIKPSPNVVRLRNRSQR